MLVQGLLPSDHVFSIIFKDDQIQKEAVGTVINKANQYISFKPDIPGTLTWIEQNTLLFKPDHLLSPGNYSYKLHYNDTKQTVKFTVPYQEITHIDGRFTLSCLMISAIFIKRLFLVKTIFVKDIESTLFLQFNNTNIPLTVTRIDSKTIVIKSAPVTRMDKDQNITLTFSKQFGVQKPITNTFTLASLNEMKPISVGKTFQDNKAGLILFFLIPS